MRKYLLITALLLALMVALLPTLAQDNAIALGESIEGALTSDALSAEYTFSGGQGDTVTITLTSEDFDSFLTLRGPGGDDLMLDDESAGDGDARIANFELPETGDYTIVAESYNRLATGDYTLSLEGTLAPTPIPSATPFVNEVFDSGLTYGQSVDGNLTADASALVYSFEGLGGDTVTITVRSSDFDSYLTLVDDGGDTLATDDDSAGNLNASIEGFTLPADGAYRALVSSYSPGAQGAFTITLEGTGAAVPPPLDVTPTFPVPTWTPIATWTPEAGATPGLPTSGSHLEIGAGSSGTISADVPEVHYTFDGTPGQAVTITAESADFDTYIYLRDSTGFNLATDDDSAGNLNSRIENFGLPADGVYTIVVSSFAPTAEGSFTVTLESQGAVATPVATAESTGEPTPEILASGEIGLGVPVEGSLDAGTVDYIFNAQASQIVVITLTSNDFDVYLTLLDASGAELAVDDDSAGSLNARINNFTLPEAGAYTIRVSSADGGGSGTFTLLVEFAMVQPTPTPGGTPISGGNTITVGSSVEGSLVGGELESYSLDAVAGQNIRVQLNADAFDPYLRIIAPDGTELATDDDSGGGLNSQVILYNLPESGRYTLNAESFDGESGDFELVVDEISVRPMEYTQTINASLDDATAYRFTGQAGDTVVIAASSSSFDTILTLYQAGESSALASDDDSGTDSNSLIGPFTLAETGEYVITVTPYDTDSGTDYTLSLERAAITSLTLGEPVTVTFEDGTSVLYYSFEAQAGDVITAVVNSDSGLDTSLTLKDPSGYEVISDDDGGAGLDPEIYRQSISSGGTYILVVQPFATGATGSVTLVVEKASLPTLNDGPQIVRLTSERVTEVLTFNGTEGQAVTMTVRALTGANNAPYVTVTQDGVTVTTANATNITDLTISFTVPVSGEVNIEVTDYTGGDVQYEVSIASS